MATNLERLETAIQDFISEEYGNDRVVTDFFLAVGNQKIGEQGETLTSRTYVAGANGHASFGVAVLALSDFESDLDGSRERDVDE